MLPPKVMSTTRAPHSKWDKKTLVCCKGRPWQIQNQKREGNTVFKQQLKPLRRGRYAIVCWMIFTEVYLSLVICHELIRGVTNGFMKHRKIRPLFYFLADFMIQVFSIYNSNAYLQKLASMTKFSCSMKIQVMLQL